MKISQIFSALFPKVNKAEGPKVSTTQKTDSKLLKQRDEVKLETDARLRAALKAELRKGNAIDKERIEELQKQVEDGTYKADTYDIAKKIIGD